MICFSIVKDTIRKEKKEIKNRKVKHQTRKRKEINENKNKKVGWLFISPYGVRQKVTQYLRIVGKKKK